MPEPAPFNRLPPFLVVLVLAVLGIEAVFQAGARGLIGGPEALGWRLTAITLFGFSDPLFEHMGKTGQIRAEGVWRTLSYAPIHLGALHAVLGAVLTLALGKAVADRLGARAVAAILVGAAIIGALAYGLLQDSRVALVGMYPAIYGLVGGFTWALFTHPTSPQRGRLLAFRLIGVLAGLQLLFLLLLGGGGNLWIADLGGFLAGFALAPMVARDAGARWRRWRERLRG